MHLAPRVEAVRHGKRKALGLLGRIEAVLAPFGIEDLQIEGQLMRGSGKVVVRADGEMVGLDVDLGGRIGAEDDAGLS